AFAGLFTGNGRIRFSLSGVLGKLVQPDHENHFRVWPRANVLLSHAPLRDSYPVFVARCPAGLSLDRDDRFPNLDYPYAFAQGIWGESAGRLPDLDRHCCPALPAL